MGRRKKSEGAPLSLFSFQDIMACLTGILILIALLLAVDGLSDKIQVAPGKPGSSLDPQAEAAEQEARERVPRLLLQRNELATEIDRRRAGHQVSEADARIMEARAVQLEEDLADAGRRLAAARAELDRASRVADAVGRQVEDARERLTAAERDSRSEELRKRVRLRPGEAFAKAPVLVEPMSGGIVIGELDVQRSPAIIADIRDPGADARALAVLRRLDPGSRYLVFVVHEDAIGRFAALRRQLPLFEEGWQLWDGVGSMFDGAPVGPNAEPGTAVRTDPAEVIRREGGAP